MLTKKQKTAYGLGDFASNLVFQTVANFMLIFYTDVFGLSAALAGSIIGLVRLSDMLTDPLMGALADRTRSKWGRFRPYLLFASLPFAILFVLAFTTPGLDGKLKYFYAGATYALMMLIYTVINIPYAALGGVMTQDPKERASLQSYRFACAMIAGMLVVWTVPRLVEYFGQGSPERGYVLTIGVLAVLAFIAFLLCFWGTSESADHAPAQKEGIWEDIVALFKNDQWFIVFMVSFLLLVMFSLRVSVAPHFVKYYLGQDNEFLSNFLLYANVAALIAAFFTNYVTAKFEKKWVLILFSALLTLFGVCLSLVPQGDTQMATLCYIATQYCQNVVVIILFAMVADSVDYGEWKTGKRIVAMTFSGHLLAIKFGFGLGGALAGWLLSSYSFEANVEQSVNALQGMSYTFGLFPAICSALCVVVAWRYTLTVERVSEIQRSLKSPS